MKFNKFDGPYTNPNIYCISCVNLYNWSGSMASCKAYPDGIPMKLWDYYGEICPCKGNKGFKYEEIQLTEEELANLPEIVKDI